MTENGSQKVKHRFQGVWGESCDPDESDYTVNLPSSIFDELGVEEGVEDEVFLQLVDNKDEPVYIRGRKTEEDEGGTTTEGYFNVIDGGSLNIPNWADDFLPHPLYQVAIEINLIEDHFRIYSPEDYCQHRIPQLRKQGVEIQQSEPVVGPLVLSSGVISSLEEETVESIAPWSVSSQRFRLIMYDAYDPIFQQKTSFTGDRSTQAAPYLCKEIEDTEELPVYPVEELRIEWARNPQGRSYDIYSYSGSPLEEMDLILPEAGIYTIYTKTEKGELNTWLRYDDSTSSRMNYVGDGWGGTGLEIPEEEEYSIAYIPCKTID